MIRARLKHIFNQKKRENTQHFGFWRSSQLYACLSRTWEVESMGAFWRSRKLCNLWINHPKSWKAKLRSDKIFHSHHLHLPSIIRLLLSLLVGGWATELKKDARQIGSFLQIFSLQTIPKVSLFNHPFLSITFLRVNFFETNGPFFSKARWFQGIRRLCGENPEGDLFSSPKMSHPKWPNLSSFKGHLTFQGVITS